MSATQNFAVIVAAGKGLRMGSEIKKQYLLLEGVPVLSRTLQVFDTSRAVDEIVLVVSGSDVEFCREKIISPYTFSKPIHMVAGGSQRQESVSNGLQKIRQLIKKGKEAIVLIHDGVRPFVEHDIIENCILNAKKYGACLPAVKMTDTVKKVEAEHLVKQTIKRDELFCAQTPQTFMLDLITDAFEYAVRTGFAGTDDASLVEQMGGQVMIVKGSRFNIKLTSPEDLILGRFILSRNIG